MTRSQKIALAMYGPRKPWTVQWGECEYGFYPKPAHACYEAMDDPEPYQDVNTSDRIAAAPPVITGGNFGMPCA